jgi:hypothetical protein
LRRAVDSASFAAGLRFAAAMNAAPHHAVLPGKKQTSRMTILGRANETCEPFGRQLPGRHAKSFGQRSGNTSDINNLTHRFPLIVEALARLRSRSCILDGEAVACDDHGIATSSRVSPQTLRSRPRLQSCANRRRSRPSTTPPPPPGAGSGKALPSGSHIADRLGRAGRLCGRLPLTVARRGCP